MGVGSHEFFTIPRQGQWLRVDGIRDSLYPGVFRSRDGKAVGIMCYRDVNGGRGGLEPSHVQLVDGRGENLMIDVAGVKMAAQITPFYDAIEPVTDRRDIPWERIKHLPANWQPRP